MSTLKIVENRKNTDIIGITYIIGNYDSLKIHHYYVVIRSTVLLNFYLTTVRKFLIICTHNHKFIVLRCISTSNVEPHV